MYNGDDFVPTDAVVRQYVSSCSFLTLTDESARHMYRGERVYWTHVIVEMRSDCVFNNSKI